MLEILQIESDSEPERVRDSATDDEEYGYVYERFELDDATWTEEVLNVRRGPFVERSIGWIAVTFALTSRRVFRHCCLGPTGVIQFDFPFAFRPADQVGCKRLDPRHSHNASGSLKSVPAPGAAEPRGAFLAVAGVLVRPVVHR